MKKDNYFNGNMFRDYVEWRKDNPSDDLVTELLNVEFEDIDGQRRKLREEELLVFLGVIANAGTETVGRLFGWLGKVLADHPDQRRELAADPSLIPGPSKKCCDSNRPSTTSPGMWPKTWSTRARPCPPAVRCC